MFAILLKLAVIFMMAVPGVIAYALFPGLEGPRLTFVTLLNELLPVGIRGLVLNVRRTLPPTTSHLNLLAECHPFQIHFLPFGEKAVV